MNNKYIINEVVFDYNSKSLRTIKDYESFDGMVLYYFEEGGASPEQKLIHSNFETFRNIVSIPMEEKEKQIDKVLKGLTNELNELF